MTFRQFAASYLNPFFIAYRFALLGSVIFGLIIASNSESAFLKMVEYLICAWVFWIAIKPWGKGRNRFLGLIRRSI